jgi:hypothetical protein
MMLVWIRFMKTLCSTTRLRMFCGLGRGHRYSRRRTSGRSSLLALRFFRRLLCLFRRRRLLVVRGVKVRWLHPLLLCPLRRVIRSLCLLKQAIMRMLTLVRLLVLRLVLDQRLFAQFVVQRRMKLMVCYFLRNVTLPAVLIGSMLAVVLSRGRRRRRVTRSLNVRAAALPVLSAVAAGRLVLETKG